jgi:hypothetical protein
MLEYHEETVKIIRTREETTTSMNIFVPSMLTEQWPMGSQREGSKKNKRGK